MNLENDWGRLNILIRSKTESLTETGPNLDQDRYWPILRDRESRSGPVYGLLIGLCPSLMVMRMCGMT